MKKINADALKKFVNSYVDECMGNQEALSLINIIDLKIDSMPDLSKPKRQKEIEINGVKFWFTKETHKVLNEDDEEVDEIYYYFRWGDEEFLNAVAMGMNEAKALAEVMGLELPECPT